MTQDLRLGTDLVFVPRLTASYRKYGDAFFRKLLTETELAYCHGKNAPAREAQFIKHAAGRIAVKEAVAKALGIGMNGLGWSQGAFWREIEVTSQSQSPPGLQLHGRALEAADRLGIRAWRLSLSHDGDYAVATVIGLL
jgi:holo-[acyl-carrier protein] synthase